MKIQDLCRLSVPLACVAISYTCGYFTCSRNNNKTENATKQLSARDVAEQQWSDYYDAKEDSLKQDLTAAQTTTRFEFFARCDSIKNTNANNAKKNAAIVKALEEYKANVSAHDREYIMSLIDLSHEYEPFILKALRAQENKISR